MKRLYIAMLSLIGVGIVQADDSYLDYRIPDDADKYGPIATRDTRVTQTKYYKKGANPRDRKSMIAAEYHRKGVLIERKLYKEKKLHGMQKTWHPDGTLETEAPYKKGVMHGVFQHWNVKGQLVGKYEMNSGSGIRVVFDETGRIKLLDPYAVNSRTGLYIEQNLKLWSLSFINYRNGKIVGMAYSFRDLNNLRAITSFSNKGDYHGVFIRYQPDGSLQEISFYVDGVKVDEIQYAKAQKKGRNLPPVFEDPHEYKKLFSQSIKHLVKVYKTVEVVKQ